MPITGPGLKRLVEERLGEPVPCFGHCEEKAELKFIREEEGELIACNVCPSGYVSRIISYRNDADTPPLSLPLSRLLSGQDVRNEDFRVATRYRWDLGIEGGDERVMKETYWTQNYRRTKSDIPDRSSLFLCSDCGSLFNQPFGSDKSRCNICRARS